MTKKAPEFTFAPEIFSDMHKDAYGFRPRGHRFYDPSTSDEEKQRIWDATYSQVLAEIQRAKDEQSAAVAIYETRIDQLIKVGAKDRGTAIRWIRDAYGDSEDIGYIEFCLDLPYGHIANDPALIK